MIGSFRDKALESLYYDGANKKTRRIPGDLRRVILRKVDMLELAVDLNDLRMPPANRLEALRGDLKGNYSIRVNRQWRIVFRWENDTAHDIRLVDYH